MFIAGESGVGKTRLMAEARRLLAGRAHRLEFAGGVVRRPGGLGLRVKPGARRILVIEHPSPLQLCVADAMRALWELGDLPLEEPAVSWEEVRAQLAGCSAPQRRALVVEGIARSAEAYVVFLDNLDRISAAQEEFLRALMQVATVCASGAGPGGAQAEHPFLRAFERMPLRPLGAEAAGALVDRLLRDLPVAPEDQQMYRREVLDAADGNPEALRTILWRTSREQRISLAEIRSIRRMERTRYFNMGPIYIFGVALVTLARILAIGTRNTEFVIYFSALGFVAYIAFRVFRPFFVFRPRRED
jgi:hypothetical protein